MTKLLPSSVMKTYDLKSQEDHTFNAWKLHFNYLMKEQLAETVTLK